MKRFFNLRTLQLLFFIFITIDAAVLIFTDSELFHMVATNDSVRLLTMLMWFALLVEFVFILIDFTRDAHNRRDIHDLSSAVHSDPASGIANRYSCDMIINMYLDKPLPEDLGCMMIDLFNVGDINRDYGHVAGNDLIRQFSQLLLLSAGGECFVGRNGGNRFLVIFEDCTEEKIDTFLKNVEEAVYDHNNEKDALPIDCTYSLAFHEPADKDIYTITDLIALCNRRLNVKNHRLMKKLSDASNTQEVPEKRDEAKSDKTDGKTIK